jgi:hypothetical protein
MHGYDTPGFFNRLMKCGYAIPLSMESVGEQSGEMNLTSENPHLSR